MTVFPPDHVFAGLKRNAYGAILADPPWGFQCWDGKDKRVASRGSVTPYDTMEMDDIAALSHELSGSEDSAALPSHDG